MSIGDKHIAVIGGCGHVGLPLGVKFALAGFRTTLVDVNEAAVHKVNRGQFPFLEEHGDEQLKLALDKGLRASTDPTVCADVNIFVFVTGTPVDEHLNPKLSEVLGIIDSYQEYFSPGDLIVMRSTLYPGTIEHLSNRFKEQVPDVHLAFCPERVSQGYALTEIDTLPQVVSSFDDKGFELACEVFQEISPSIIKLTPLEAELTKLMANAWRYLEFAIANQFYMIAEDSGIDFYRVFDAIRYDYPRAHGYKSPGFAAGPCLFKDTMQLASYFKNQFFLGHSAMLVNERLASFVVDKAAAELGGPLHGKRIGILGMTFKANNDDIRESLSFKVKKSLLFEGARVLWHDPHLDDSMPLEKLLSEADALILCTPHNAYKSLKFTKPIIDCWGYFRETEVELYPGKSASEGG